MRYSDKFGTVTNGDTHSKKMVGNAEQLKTRYRKIGRIILDNIGIKEYQWEQHQPLETYLGLKSVQNPAVELIESQMEKLPIMGNIDTRAITFERIKELHRLSAKRKAENRNTYDVYGMQLWLNNPKHVRRIIKDLSNTQSPLYRSLKSKIHSFDNFFEKPKRHGYSALHIDIREGTGRFTAYGEIQIMPFDMMLSYLSTRSTYSAMREIEEYTINCHSSDEDKWPETERVVIEALRLSIKARYEADLYACGLMDLRNPNHKHSVSFNNEQEARQAAEALQPIADGITNRFLNYGSQIDYFMENIDTIAQPYINQGLYMAGYEGNRYLCIDRLLDNISGMVITIQPEFSLSPPEHH